MPYYYSEPCEMYELMLKRQREGQGRIHMGCLKRCKSESTCGFYDKQNERWVRRKNGNGHNGSNGSQKKGSIGSGVNAIKPGEVERIINETMPEPSPTDKGGV